jgi:hypothetical protein
MSVRILDRIHFRCRPFVSRTQYESEADRRAETSVIEKVVKAFDVDGYYKLPISYVLDFAVTKSNRVIGFVEVKARSCEMKTYPTFFVAVKKVLAAGEFDRLGLKTRLFVKWRDCIGYTLLREPDQITYGGRFDRGDPADQEPLAHFDINRFSILEE